MISLNELRLGNWFFDGFTDRKGNLLPATVKQILEKVPEDTFMEPIPLTPEILEKAGFVNCGYDFMDWVKESNAGKFLIIGAWDSENEMWVFGIKFNGEIDVDIDHVHQLQNLYFALTSEELEINL